MLVTYKLMQASKQHTLKVALVPPACTAPMASRKREAALGASTGAPALAIGADWAAGLATFAATEAAFTVREWGVKPSNEG